MYSPASFRKTRFVIKILDIALILAILTIIVFIVYRGANVV